MKLLAQIAPPATPPLPSPRLPLQIFILFYVFFWAFQCSRTGMFQEFRNPRKTNWNYITPEITPEIANPPAWKETKRKEHFAQRGTKYGGQAATELIGTIAPLILTVVVGKEHVKLGLQSQQKCHKLEQGCEWSFVTLRIILSWGPRGWKICTNMCNWVGPH